MAQGKQETRYSEPMDPREHMQICVRYKTLKNHGLFLTVVGIRELPETLSLNST